MDWMGVPWLASIAIALFCWIFITLWGAALVAIWAGFLFWINQKSKLLTVIRVLIGTALWCSLEALWSSGSLWWSSLSYTQSPHNLIILHLGQLSGPATVTAAIVAVNGLIAEAWISYQYSREQGRERVSEKGSKRNIFYPSLGKSASPSPYHPITYIGMALGLMILLHLIGFSLYSRPLVQAPQAALKVGIIQGNIPNRIKVGVVQLKDTQLAMRLWQQKVLMRF
jgi:apolipoprotein N-acyltransferase